ncbi:hypothetical protein V2647_03580 [Tenacibaculum maritimum]|uniref:hypothetical protein n=1 Tax=Tenacibaculum maritimum TaxID=107401 RepID=UPI001330E2B0|nr:hypothetical protein [Tenacibaculum maritimum]
MEKPVEKIEELTTRELQEKQLKHIANISRNSTTIKNNLQYFFWLSIIIILFSIFLAVVMA